MGLKFLDKVIKKKNIRSYIIGGDFNFNTSTKVPNLPGNVVIGSYDLSPRSQNRTKRFIYVSRTTLYIIQSKT
jgi:hypothetical protein